MVDLHVHNCAPAPFPYLGNGWTDCAEIYCVVRDPSARRFTKVLGRVQQQARAHPSSVSGERLGGWCRNLIMVRGALAMCLHVSRVARIARVHPSYIPFNNRVLCYKIWCLLHVHTGQWWGISAGVQVHPLKHVFRSRSSIAEKASFGNYRLFMICL